MGGSKQNPCHVTAKHPFSTRRGRKLRAEKLSAEPRCEPCLRKGRLSLATTVHHIVPLEQGGEPFPPLDGLVPMCEDCHKATHGARPRQGCDANGYPPVWKV